LRLSAFSIVLLLAGCASTPTPQAEFVPPVYPPPPDEPRFVYERTLLYSDDVEEYTSGMRFRDFALGESRKLKGLVKPFDVAVHEGRVYVSDTVQRAVIVFDIPGKRYFEIGTEEPGGLVKPLGIDVAADGQLYVCDVSARRVMVYSAEGQYERALGTDLPLQRPSDVALSPDDQRVYIVDTGGVDSDNHYVYVLDSESGELIQRIGRRGENDGEFNLPLQATVAPDGTLYVVDSGNFRVEAFDSAGNFQASFGGVGRFPGQFARPKGIAADAAGNLYVIDTAFGNFQIFDSTGRLLMFIGERGQSGYPGKFMLPAGIDVGNDGRIYVVDQFFRKVDVFRPASTAVGASANGESP
jgi:DNA-binding beta-propeller fold protein YncE